MEKKMQIQIPSDQESFVQSLAVSAGFATVDQYVMDLIERDGERAAIQVGLEQAVRGEGRSMEEFDAAFRKRKGIHVGN
jgi:hypothetical protein